MCTKHHPSDDNGQAGGCWSMGNTAAHAGAVGPFTGLRAAVYYRIVRRRLRPARSPSEGTAASADSAAASAADHATFRERADALVRCMGLGVKLNMPRYLKVLV